MSRRTSLFRPRAAALVLGLVALAGCQSAGERITEAATERLLEAGGDHDVDLSADGIRIEGADGQSFSAGETAEVPQRIADVVSVPEGFAPANAFEQHEYGQRATTVAGELADRDPAAVIDEIETAMSTDGWETEGKTSVNDSILGLGLRRGEATLTVSLFSDGDEMMLTLALVEPA